MTASEVDSLMATHLMETLGNVGHFHVLSKPFVEWKGAFYLLNPRALDNALGVGLFFAALDAGNKAVDFFALAGRFFQDYAGNFLRAIASRSGTYFHNEVVDAMRRDSTDFFILEGDRLNFFEVRYGRVARPAIESLDPAKIEASFADTIYSKACQLDRNVRAFADCDLDIPGVARRSVNKICPVIVLPHPFPRSPAVQVKIDAELAAHGWLPTRVKDIDVAPLEIIEAESLEGLDGLEKPVSFSDLIERKTKNPKTRHTFLKNFLVDHEHLVLKMSEESQRRRADWLAELRSETERWILK